MQSVMGALSFICSKVRSFDLYRAGSRSLAGVRAGCPDLESLSQ
jgi:hypothetical protein